MTGWNWRDGVGRVSIILPQTDVRDTERRGKRKVIMMPVRNMQNQYVERAMDEADRKRWNSMGLNLLLTKMEAGDLPIVIRDGRIWGFEMDRLELEAAREKAWSFPGLQPPENARYIGYQKIGTEKYLYWRDSRGNYWFDTEGGMAFKKEMEEIQKKKRASRRRWMPG